MGKAAFNFGMLPPGRYDVSASAPGMATKTSHAVELLVGGVSVVHLRLAPVAPTQTITVNATPVAVETQSGEVSNVVTQSAITGLPLNGRRFTDLALLSPDVIQDPRGQTSDSNGDLSVGGVRGFQNSFLVDGTDDNNSFFAQARGRLSRALSVQQRSDQGISRLEELLQRRAGTLRRRGVQRGDEVGNEQMARHGLLLFARSRLRRAAALRQQPAGRSPATVRRHAGRTDSQRPHLLLCRIRSASADGALGRAVRQRVECHRSSAHRLRLHR